MKFSNFKYLVKQGFSNFKENRLMSVASIGVIISCLFIVGVCGLLAANINSFAKFLGDQNEVVAYLYDDASEEQVNHISEFLKGNENVASYDYISKEEALQEQMGYLGEYGDLLESYTGDNNPLPASFRIKVKDLTKIQITSDQLSQLGGVELLSTPTELAGVLITIKNAAYYGGVAVLAILVFVSIVVISNTIRLTVFARRKEINIMKFVGATNGFIRLPFIVEGVIIGTIGAVITFGVLSGGYYYLLTYMAANATGWLAMVSGVLIPYADIWWIMLVAFLGFGWFIGAVGSAISMKRYLKV
ncbi:MAG: permease-like cell division protein FtsX [Oscillospiraceae bacterium]|nr:permease-like cell division protein FtsX [Oscillospiraceae bacterium]MBP1553180.1 permease-like cell division protein FtsX [Oscillospiraceae bacterium]